MEAVRINVVFNSALMIWKNQDVKTINKQQTYMKKMSQWNALFILRN